ncbi:MAG: 7-cyano-7-deazaguanine synthase QueC [Chlorobiota bacterium]
MSKLAVVLLSGGMDSAVTAAIAKEQGYDIACLHLNYGQKTQERELKQFNKLCDQFQAVSRLVTDVRFLSQIGGSSLTDEKIEITDADLDSKEIPSSYVPFRNANILAIATSWAEVIGAEALFIGAVYEDSSGYPDTRREFFEAFEKVIATGTKPSTQIKIKTPIIDMNKDEIIRKGQELNVPFSETWSCYKNNDVACGKCDSCGLRLRAFSRVGMEDPIDYK